MRHYEVREVMTADPVTVTAATPLRYVAGSLVKHRLSAVPVLSLQGKVIGVISESDLLRKEELLRNPDGDHSTHLTFRARRDMATAETAGELMTTHPATVRPDATLAEAARLMDRHEVTCLPVVDDSGKLAGVVGPRELLRAFEFADTAPLPGPERDEFPMSVILTLPATRPTWPEPQAGPDAGADDPGEDLGHTAEGPTGLPTQAIGPHTMRKASADGK